MEFDARHHAGMPEDRTSAGDPARTVALLWRAAPAARRGPRPRLRVDDVVDAAVALAGEEGLEAVTMRRLATVLGVSPMTLYGYVPTRAELLDLMVDAVYAAMTPASWSPRAGWRTRVRRVAEADDALHRARPWLAAVSTARPPLGPGQLAKYEHELSAFDGTGLTDVEVDAALTLVLGLTRWVAQARASAAEAARAGVGDPEWWAVAGPALAEHADPSAYPRASRVGTAVGAAQHAAFDADAAFAFGLQRVLDGLAALIER